MVSRIRSSAAMLRGDGTLLGVHGTDEKEAPRPRPEILLLDEPTAHLDVAREMKILKLLKDLNRENGLTVVAVLHHFNADSELCDRLVLIE